MKNKGCLLTFAAGIVAGLIGSVGLLVGGTYLFQDQLIEMKEGTLQPPPLVAGLKADYTWEVVSSEGENKSLASLKDKVAIVHLFSPTCGSCLAEWPTIVSLYTKTEAMGVPIICISMAGEDGLVDFMAEFDPPFPVYAMTTPIPPIFDSRNMPVTFIYGKDGNVAFKHSGSAKWDDDSVVEYLQGLAE